MADFVQTMKDWRRMCKAYTTDDDDCCKGCRVVDFHEYGCSAIFEMEDSTDWQEYADAIREWAAEHPEPVYPTWIDVLKLYGVTDETGYCYLDSAYKPIPDNIAEKLGLQPKEG